MTTLSSTFWYLMASQCMGSDIPFQFNCSPISHKYQTSKRQDFKYIGYLMVVIGIDQPQTVPFSSWRHQMETFSTLLVICAGNLPVTSEFPARGPVTRRFDVFFDLRLNRRLSKQWQGWWFETPSRPLRRQCNVCKCTFCRQASA